MARQMGVSGGKRSTNFSYKARAETRVFASEQQVKGKHTNF
jgi:hypothetical protein